jgi:O-antigen/teichoic acid export membrane protein
LNEAAKPPSVSENNKKIVKNTLALYFRQIITMAVALFTSRIILRALGVTDYGIYNVVGGVVAMLSFLTNSLAETTQRFLSVELGKGDFVKLKRIFANSLSLHIVFILMAVAVAETAGLWFLQNKLVIPPERANAAFWVYQFSVASFAVSVFFAPFEGVIRAREKFGFYAKMSLFDVFMKLVVVYLIVVLPYDKLAALSFMWLCVAVIGKIIVYIYCRGNFEECGIKLSWAKDCVRYLLGYNVYRMIDGVSRIIKVQGLNIVLNLYYGPVLNAAQGIANIVRANLYSFSYNATIATTPQIVMSYAQKDRQRFLSLVTKSSRLYFYLTLILTLPFILETDTALYIWLGNYPEYASVFTKLFLIEALLSALWEPLIQANSAVGKLRANTANMFACRLIVLIAAVVMGIKQLPPAYIYVTLLAAQVVSFSISLIIVWKYHLKFSLRRYLADVILPVSKTCLLAASLPAVSHYFFSKSMLSSCGVGIFTLAWSVTVVFYAGLNKNEKLMIINKLPASLRQIVFFTRER